MSSNILITGATGNVGKEVLRTLHQRGVSAAAAVRDKEKAVYLKKTASELRIYNLSFPATVEPAFSNIKTVFFVSPPANYQVEEHTAMVIQAARNMGVEKIVFLTAMGVDMNEDNLFRKSERMIEDSGLQYSFLRPNWFFQNFNSMYLEMIRQQNSLFIPADESKVSFIDVRDIAAVAAEALTGNSLNGKGITLTGPAALTHEEVAAALSRVSGKNIRYHPISEEEARSFMANAGYPDSAVDYMITLFRFVREGYMAAVNDGVKLITGKDPIGLKKYVADYRDFWK